MLTPEEIALKVLDLEASHADRDGRHSNVALIRGGHMAAVFPELFGTISDEPLVANYIDVVARDMAEMIGPLPALNCVSGMITSDRARKFAAMRQKIGLHYWLSSNLRITTISAADKYLTYGYVALKVEPDFKTKFPRMRWLDPRGGYPEFDAAGNTTSFAQKSKVRAQKLAALYPNHAAQILRPKGYVATSDQRDEKLTVYRYEDADQTVVYVKERDNLLLERLPNRLGECSVQCAVRPSPDDEMRGQFDDVLGAYAAKAYMARLGLEAAEKTVQAPIAAPDDMVDLPLGPDSILRSNSPEKIRRVPLDIGHAGLLESANLTEELRMGTRYPQGRSGQVDGSIVTGRGVEALLGTFDTQIKTHQGNFGELLRRATRLAFKCDEVYWPNLRKEIRGTSEGVPFSENYTPSKDIAGDYTCDVSYGIMAGMDPNRGLVFILQALGAGLMDRQTAARNLPFEIDVTQLMQNIEVEKMREALLAGLQATVQAIGPMIEQGGDAGTLLVAAAQAIKDRQQGKPIEDAMMHFAPPPPPEQPPGPEGAPVGPGDLPPGVQPSGLLSGVAPGQAGMPPGGRPALTQLLAQLGSAGKANLSAGVRRALPA